MQHADNNYRQINPDRLLAVLVRIRIAQANDPGARYSLPTALADIAEYERAGTLETAIQALTTSATIQADASKVQLERIFSYGSRDAATKTLDDLLTGTNGRLDQAKLQAMRACFPAAGVPAGTETGDFLYRTRIRRGEDQGRRLHADATSRAAARCPRPGPTTSGSPGT